MLQPEKKKVTYEDLSNIPEHMIGEIIDGELYVTPRPSPKHSHVASSLGGELVPPYRFGRGGPGGWIILDEVELNLGEQCHPIVPDLSGWKAERFPESIETNWISVPPDWVCEVLSPGTRRLDRVTKMSKYAEFGVHYVWLVDPSNRTLEVFRLESGRWVVLGWHTENDKVRAEPFQEIEIDLGEIWL
jgi:Uma2 family endonuclease